jgi:hypothetical protein
MLGTLHGGLSNFTLLTAERSILYLHNNTESTHCCISAATQSTFILLRDTCMSTTLNRGKYLLLRCRSAYTNTSLCYVIRKFAMLFLNHTVNCSTCLALYSPVVQKKIEK